MIRIAGRVATYGEVWLDARYLDAPDAHLEEFFDFTTLWRAAVGAPRSTYSCTLALTIKGRTVLAARDALDLVRRLANAWH